MSSFRFKVVLAGDEQVGKTAAIRRFCSGIFSESYKQTLGFEVSIKVIQVGQFPVIFSIIDVGGQKMYQGLRTNYYAGASAFLLMFDQTNRPTFDSLGEWVQEIRAIDQTSYFILVGNKNDLPNKQVTREDVTQLMNTQQTAHFTTYFQTSAKTGEGIQEMFLYVATLLLGKSAHT